MLQHQSNMWRNIPADLFGIICKESIPDKLLSKDNILWLCNLSMVCKRYYYLFNYLKLWELLYKRDLSDIPSLNPKQQYIHLIFCDNPLYIAADRGYEKCINSFTGDKSLALQRAAYRGHYAIIEKLKYWSMDGALMTAAQHGHLDIVQLLIKKYSWSLRTLLAHSINHPHVLLWLLETYPETYTNDAYIQAFESGNILALDILENHKPFDFTDIKWLHYPMVKFKFKVNFEIVKWLIEREREFFFNKLMSAVIYSGDDQTIDYCLSVANPKEKGKILYQLRRIKSKTLPSPIKDTNRYACLKNIF